MMLHLLKHFRIFVFALITFGTFSLQAQVLPDFQWKVMKGPHFDLIYNSEQQALADMYLVKAEEAWKRLDPVFSAKPDRTVLILNDSTDLANGYATRIPYPYMMLYPVLPGPLESIGEYGDWPLEFVLHEYTHILSFEPATGVVRYLRYGIGTIMAPNLVLPRWFLEGVAVENETRLSDHGRLRSTYQDAVLRAMYAENTLNRYHLAEQNEIWTPNWPSGARPYLFGSLMWNRLLQLSGPSIIDQLHQAYGGRVPYTIEAPLLRSLGLNYAQLYDQTLFHLETRLQKQLLQLGAVVFSQDTVLPIKGKQNFTPSISPDQKTLVFISENEIGDKNVKIIERSSLDQSFASLVNDTEVVQTIKDETTSKSSPSPDAPPGGTISRMSWFPDSKKFVYDKIHRVDAYRLFSDLYTYDLTNKKSTPLTDQLRAREPAVSPDGSLIVFVKLSGGITELATLKSNGSDLRILYRPPLQHRISFPLFTSESQILFSERDLRGQEHFFFYNLKTTEVTVALAREPQLRFASPAPQGGIFYTSSANGTNNVYWSDLKFKTMKPLTHLATSAFVSAYDSHLNELYFTKMTADGFKISMIKLSQQDPLPNRLPRVSALFSDRYPPYSETHPEKEAEKTINPQVAKREYSALPYLWPRYWIPSFYQDSNGLYFQFMTASQDPLGKHRYSVQLGWDNYIGRPSGFISYTNATDWWQWSLLGSEHSSYFITKENTYRDSEASFLLGREIVNEAFNYTPVFGWSYKQRNFDQVPLERSGPVIGINYIDLKQTPAQISPESGRSAQLSFTKYLASTSDLEYEQWSFSGVQFFSKWLPARNAIMMRFQGTTTSKEIPFIFGASTTGGNYSSELLPSYFLLRGYPSGQLVGRNLYTANLEYRFLIADHYKGWNTWAFFLRRSHMALFADIGATDGSTYNATNLTYEPTSIKKTMSSIGAEYKLDTTTGNFIPLRFIFGLYNSLTEPAKKETSVFFGLQI